MCVPVAYRMLMRVDVKQGTGDCMMRKEIPGSMFHREGSEGLQVKTMDGRGVRSQTGIT